MGKKGKAVIVGGSLGGVACAHALIRAGWDVVVLEKTTASAPSGNPTGAGLGLDTQSREYIQSWLPQDRFLHHSTLPLAVDVVANWASFAAEQAKAADSQRRTLKGKLKRIEDSDKEKDIALAEAIKSRDAVALELANLKKKVADRETEVEGLKTAHALRVRKLEDELTHLKSPEYLTELNAAYRKSTAGFNWGLSRFKEGCYHVCRFLAGKDVPGVDLDLFYEILTTPIVNETSMKGCHLVALPVNQIPTGFEHPAPVPGCLTAGDEGYFRAPAVAVTETSARGEERGAKVAEVADGGDDMEQDGENVREHTPDA